MAFGVKTANMFELLGDEDAAPAPAKAVAKPQADAKKATPALSGAANVEARMKGGSVNGPANGRGEGRGGRGGRGRGGGRNFDRAPREGIEGGEGSGERGPRPSRGRGGGGRHFERDRNRGYDRHDGTGRGHEVEKKGGHGGHNWGAPGEEEAPAAAVGGDAVWQDDPVTETPAVESAAPAESASGADAEAAAEAAEPEEPEKEEMTLDEYEKLQEEKRGALKKKPTNTVKVDTKAFEGMKVVHKAEENNELELSEKKTLGKSKSGGAEKVRKEKELLPTGFRVGSAEAGGRGRGRGDRGGRFSDRFGDRPERERPPRRNDENGRGYGGRGGGRGDKPSSGGRGRGRDGPPPTIEDNVAFPTLGA